MAAPARFEHPVARLLAFALALALFAAAALALGAGTASAHSHARSHRRTHRSACAHRASYRSGSHRRRTRRCRATHHSRRRRHTAAHHVQHTAPSRSSTAEVPCAGTGATPSATNAPLLREAVLCLVNRERAAHGEPPLRVNAQLQQAAQAHTESMAQGAYFGHDGPGGDTPAARMRAFGYLPGGAALWEVGENIAWGSLWLGSPKAIVEGWMASPGHRANILYAGFRDTAVGVSTNLPGSFADGQSGAIYTQDFGVRVY